MLGHSTRALTTTSKGESYKRLITTKAIDQAFKWTFIIVMMRLLLIAVMRIEDVEYGNYGNNKGTGYDDDNDNDIGQR